MAVVVRVTSGSGVHDSQMALPTLEEQPSISKKVFVSESDMVRLTSQEFPLSYTAVITLRCASSVRLGGVSSFRHRRLQNESSR